MKQFIKNFDEDKLKEAFKIKQAYINGDISLELANAQMKAHVGTITPSELSYLEQTFEEEVDDECIKEDIERMLAIYDGVLVETDDELFDGHPIKNYIDENNAIRKVVDDIQNLLENKFIKNECDELFEKLNEYKTHLSRKQNQLYTELEKKGFDRPTKTMWLYDNAIRDSISELKEIVVVKEDLKLAKSKFYEFKDMILDLMEKEENILYPTSLEMLDKEVFVNMISGDKEIGYCLIEPVIDYEKHSDFKVSKQKPLQKAEHKAKSKVGLEDDFKSDLSKLLSKYGVDSWDENKPMNVKQGLLSLNQINLVFSHLPVDISYVDENELVAFYSDTKHRVFPRSKGVIGRDVKNCHPKNSVAIVEEIIEKFRSGERDKAEFWINKPDLFIYIIYVAVREEDGTFRGVLEMMQDCTAIRKLEGSRTLLSWDSDNKIDLEEEKVEEKVEDNAADNSKITVLQPTMKVKDIFKQYQALKDYMVSKSDKFKMLNSPMFKVIGKVATVKDVSERTDIPLDVLQKEFEKYLEQLKKEEL